MRWAEQHKYPVEVFETSYAEEAGLKSADLRHPRAVRLRHPVGRGRHPPPRADQPLRQPGPAPDVVRRRRGRPGPRADRRDRDPRRGDPCRRLPLRRARRPVGQHHRLRGAPDAHPHRHRRQLPEREVAAAEQGLRDGRAQGQAARAEEGRGEGPPRRASRATCRRRGATRCATTCSTRTRSSRTCGPPTSPATRRPSSTATSTRFLEAGIRWRRGAEKVDA